MEPVQRPTRRRARGLRVSGESSGGGVGLGGGEGADVCLVLRFRFLERKANWR